MFSKIREGPKETAIVKLKLKTSQIAPGLNRIRCWQLYEHIDPKEESTLIKQNN